MASIHWDFCKQSAALLADGAGAEDRSKLFTVVFSAAVRLQGNAIVRRILSSGGRAGDTAPFESYVGERDILQLLRWELYL